MSLHSGKTSYFLNLQEMELHTRFRFKTSFMGHQVLHVEGRDCLCRSHDARSFHNFKMLDDPLKLKLKYFETVNAFKVDVLMYHSWELLYPISMALGNQKRDWAVTRPAFGGEQFHLSQTKLRKVIKKLYEVELQFAISLNSSGTSRRSLPPRIRIRAGLRRCSGRIASMTSGEKCEPDPEASEITGDKDSSDNTLEASCKTDVHGRRNDSLQLFLDFGRDLELGVKVIFQDFKFFENFDHD